MEEIQKHTITAKEIKNFLEERALYSWSQITKPDLHIQLFPDLTLELYCDYCKKERPFKDYRNRVGGAGLPMPQPLSTTLYYTYTCTGCEKYHYDFYVQYDADKSRMRKIGQNPPWSIAVDAEIESIIAEDVEYFKRAKICESQGFGIAAFAYYRRVLENSFNKILEKMLSIAEEDSDSDQIEIIRKAIENRVSEEKIKLIKEKVPKYLLVKGNNPFEVLYSSLSAGIHNYNEEDCLRNSEKIRIGLTFIIKTIKRIFEERDVYSKAIKGLVR